MESIGLTCEVFFIANFHVLGLFMPKKQVLSEKKFSVCHAAFEFSGTFRQLGWIDATHTQNFEIRSKVLLKNSEIYLKNGQKKFLWKLES
jgi:hypothetical protein